MIIFFKKIPFDCIYDESFFIFFFFARRVAEEDVDVNEFSNVEEKANAILRAGVEEVELDAWK